MYELIVKGSFSAAHRLRDYHGKCENLHGHNWDVEVSISSTELNRVGMVMDFAEVKSLLAEILDEFDHVCLNEIVPFANQNPTTENIAREIFYLLRSRLPDNLRLNKVIVGESPGCAVCYSE